MKGREPRLSSKKPYFPNVRSAVISIAVVCVLLVLAVLVLDRSNALRLNKYNAKIEIARNDAVEQIDLRFSYAEKLASLITDRTLAAPLESAISLYSRDLGTEELSIAYTTLDSALSVLQKQIYQESDYLLYLAYFEKMYDCETALKPAVLAYNSDLEYFNRQIAAFPTKLVAKRLKMVPLSPFTVAKALKSRL
jgi:hypothetical protein